jgi:hypothetical protein
MDQLWKNNMGGKQNRMIGTTLWYLSQEIFEWMENLSGPDINNSGCQGR